MAYATVNDVKNYFLNLSFPATGAGVTSVKVQFHLNAIEPRINDKLSLACEVPITDADDLKRVVDIHAKWVAGIVDNMRWNERTVKSEDRLTKPRNLIKDAKDELESIVNGETAFNSISKTNVASGDADLDLRDLSEEDLGHAGRVND